MVNELFCGCLQLHAQVDAELRLQFKELREKLKANAAGPHTKYTGDLSTLLNITGLETCIGVKYVSIRACKQNLLHSFLRRPPFGGEKAGMSRKHLDQNGSASQ